MFVDYSCLDYFATETNGSTTTTIAQVQQLDLLRKWTNFFDRIYTGIAADVVPTASLLEAYVPCLKAENPFATLLTFHRIWRMDKRYVQKMT